MRLRVLVAVARTGSVTAAAQELHYSQPAVSHHLARLEAETGAKLIQRVGRGIRLTEAGRLLAERAEEILGRIESASAELAAYVGLRSGRVRLAAFPSALGTFVPTAAVRLAERHPGLELCFTEAEPPEALRMLRAGQVDVAVLFRYGEAEPDEEGVRLTHLFDEPGFLVLPAAEPGAETLAGHAGSRWIAGCERCRAHLLRLLRGGGVRAARLVHHRRLRRGAGDGGRRARGGGAARARPHRPSPPRDPHRAAARVDPAGLRRDVRGASDPPPTAALLTALLGG